MKYGVEILKELTEGIKKTVWALGSHTFLFILILILIDIALGGIIFYKYVFLVKTEVPRVTESVIKFDDKTYHNVLEQLQLRERVYLGF